MDKFEVVRFSPSDKKLFRAFLELPYRLYRGNKYYVPPLRGELRKLLRSGSGMQLEGGEFTLLLALCGKKPCGRLLAGVNRVKNAQRGTNEGYISLFECENNADIASALFADAESWLREKGVDMVTGPTSPTNGDDDRGVLISGFECMPAVNTSYTPDYYKGLFENAGYEKYLDFYAFGLTTEKSAARAQRIMQYGQKKLNLTISPFDMNDVKGECRAIHDVFVSAMRDQWNHLEIPSEQQIYGEFLAIKRLINPSLVQIARIDGAPVGFVVALPDYNQVLCHIDGRLDLVGALKFLYYRRKINRIRVFMQFVLPKYQNTAVLASLYSALYVAYKRGGYTQIEGSTIAEFNTASLAALKGLDFEVTRVYRIFQKAL